ncbi:MAG: response regulator [Paracoccaceae bacterium]
MTQFGDHQPAVVLLAEDDEINQQIVRYILSDLAFINLVIAPDGKAALEAALSQRFDLMIFDRHMPLISGDRVIRHLRASQTINSGTPIIQFTADADHTSIGTAGAGHADAVVPKPVQGDQLRAAVLHLLDRHRRNKS